MVVDYGNNRALDGVSFSVGRGEIFCLLGPNGAGKTTMVRALTGQVKKTRGSVLLLGKDPNVERGEVLSRSGLVPQDVALYGELTGRENLEFHARLHGLPSDVRKERVEALLEVAGLKGRQHDRVSTYSGGMKRRLQLVRALVHDPEVLFLDEPTLGVDVQSRNAIHEHVRRLPSRGKTIFLTTNYMEEAEALADRILILDGKTIEGPAPLQEIRERTLPGLVLEFQVEGGGGDLLAEFVGEQLDGTLLSVKNVIGGVTEFQVAVERAILEDALETLLLFTKSGGLSLRHVTIKQATLNDVFLHLTGKAFRD